MVNKKAFSVVLGACLLAAGWGSSGWSAEAKGGKAVYEKSCVACHGADGKGNPAMAKVLGEKGLNLTTKEVAQMSDEKALKILAEGAGKMPAQKSLSKDDQKQVVNYIRSLAK